MFSPIIAQANNYFRNKCYIDAIVLYGKIIKTCPHFKKMIEFNLKLLEKKCNIDKNNQEGLMNILEIIRGSGLFDQEWYISNYSNKYNILGDPLIHYLIYGVIEGINPSNNFDTSFYLEKNTDVNQLCINPLVHYINFGKNEGRQTKLLSNEILYSQEVIDQIKNSNLFNNEWYVFCYSAEHNIGNDALIHYLNYGATGKFNPSTKFNTSYYLTMNPDVKASGINPLVHYLTIGKKEGRLPTSAPPRYDSRYPVEPLEYIQPIHDLKNLRKAVRLIAFYLPQFHPIPENDLWWGKGFTEWTNVEPARPYFEGHYQPHIPHDYLGYYNLLDASTQEKQVKLAKEYGIEGFCFYFYWFSGKRLLEKPLDNYLNNKSLDVPFCLCWANENWTRRWDGLDQDLLIGQNYHKDDDVNFITDLYKYLKDERYIKVDGKPLILVYRPSLLPEIKETVNFWREICRKNNIGEIYLAYPQAFDKVHPAIYGFDAAIEFPPSQSPAPHIMGFLNPTSSDFQSTVYDWRWYVENSECYQSVNYKLFRGVCPSWDNTARKKSQASIFHNSSPKLFTQWLSNAFVDTIISQSNHQERLVFVNAWNEWAEGTNLEPDQKHGYAWLKSVADAHNIATTTTHHMRVAFVIHAFYYDVLEEIISKIYVLNISDIKIFVSTHGEIFEKVKYLLLKSELNFHLDCFENHGRDVLPFIKQASNVLADDYWFIVKIHTKKSKHRLDGDQWRNSIYNELLSEKFLKTAYNKMQIDKEIAMVSPSKQLIPLTSFWGENSVNVFNLAKRANIPINDSDIININFIAGTMFIVHRDIISDLLKLNLQGADFELEAGQVDGTLAHAVERFFSILCWKKKLRVVGLGKNGVENQEFQFAEVTEN